MEIDTNISDENFKNYRENWLETARSIKTKEDFDEFYNILINLKHGYNSHAEAIAAIGLAAFNLSACVLGATGFSTSCALWGVISGTKIFDDKCGLKMISYRDMLYPQMEYKFEKTISKDTWDRIREEAAISLSDTQYMADRVKQHMEDIVDGHLPWGFTVSKE